MAGVGILWSAKGDRDTMSCSVGVCGRHGEIGPCDHTFLPWSIKVCVHVCVHVCVCVCVCVHAPTDVISIIPGCHLGVDVINVWIVVVHCRS